MFFLTVVTTIILALLIACALFSPRREKKIPLPKCLHCSTSNPMKIGYVKRIGCSDILKHNGVEIQEKPCKVPHHKCVTTFADAANAGQVGIVDGKQVGLFTEDTAVAPKIAFDYIGAFVSFFVTLGRVAKLSLHQQFAPYTTESPLCMYSSTVSITFNGTDVTTITCMVECECVPERKGNGGKIDACMVPIQVISLTLKDGDSDEKSFNRMYPLTLVARPTLNMRSVANITHARLH